MGVFVSSLYGQSNIVEKICVSFPLLYVQVIYSMGACIIEKVYHWEVYSQ